jgi:hypothetical protein
MHALLERVSLIFQRDDLSIGDVGAEVNTAIDEMQKRGFKAVYVNRNGFPDRGKGLLEALAELGFDTAIDSPLGDLTCVVLGKPAGK